MEVLAGVDQRELRAGDQLVIETPGGGGFGVPKSAAAGSDPDRTPGGRPRFI